MQIDLSFKIQLQIMEMLIQKRQSETVSTIPGNGITIGVGSSPVINGVGVTNGKHSAKAVGLCLLVVLLSFGILFNSNSNSNINSNFPFKFGTRDSLLNSESANSKQVYTGRLLKSVDTVDSESETALQSVNKIEQAIKKSVSNNDMDNVDSDSDASSNKNKNKSKNRDTSASVAGRKHSTEDAIDSLSKSLPLPTSEPTSKRQKVKIADDTNERVQFETKDVANELVLASQSQRAESSALATRGTGTGSGSGSALLLDKVATAVAPSSIGYSEAERPNTSYIYCSEAQQLHSTVQPSQSHLNIPENIALLIPSSVLLNSTLDPQFDTSLLEISCQILNLHVWPLQQNNAPSPTNRN